MTLHDARTIQNSAEAVPISIEVSTSTSKASAPANNASEIAEPVVSETPSTPLPESETVPLALYQAVQQELIRYKALFGELPTHPQEAPIISEQVNDAPSASESEVPSALHQANVSPSLQSDPAQSLEEAEALLQILAINDQDLAAESVDLKELLNLGIPINSDPLRHFGFQRSKPCKK